MSGPIIKAREIGLFGAFERHNFGDWLMAFCADSLLQPQFTSKWIYDFATFGVGVNDNCGNFYNLKDFAREYPIAPIIHVGGETLACPSSAAISMSSQPIDTVINRPIFYVLPEYLEGITPRRAFFGVGGTNISDLSNQDLIWLQDSLNSAKFVSARDPITHEKLKQLQIDAQLHPDIVSVISKISSQELKKAESSRKIVFQINELLLSSNMQFLTTELVSLFKDFDSIVFVVAGIAPGHDSFERYLQLAHKINLERPNWAQILFDLHPLSIVEEIASSDLVVATSLHFRIVAMSFGIPRISISVPKALRYGAHWDISEFGAANLSEVKKWLKPALSYSKSELFEHGKGLSQNVEKNWKEMMRSLDE